VSNRWSFATNTPSVMTSHSMQHLLYSAFLEDYSLGSLQFWYFCSCLLSRWEMLELLSPWYAEEVNQYNTADKN